MLTARLVVRLVVFSTVLMLLSATWVMAQTLRFDPDPVVPTEPNFMVPLVLEAGGLEVKGVEAIVSFDPALVTLVSVTPGPWYILSGQTFFFWDYTTSGTDRIHFASAMLQGTSSSDGIIAYCHFSMVSFGSCPLDFIEGDVRDINNDPLPFALDPGLILLDPAVGRETSTLDGLKALFR